MFQKMMEEYSQKETYTLKDYKKEIEESLKNARSGIQKLWSGTEPEELESIMSRKVLNALTPDELIHNAKLTMVEKQEIAQVVQCEIEVINKVLTSFNSNKRVHEYIRARKERGEHLPSSREELMQIMHLDPPPKSKDQAFAKTPRFNSKQLKKEASKLFKR